MVPEKCLLCSAPWKGGSQVPGSPFPKVGARVHYECGSILRVSKDLDEEESVLRGDRA